MSNAYIDSTLLDKAIHFAVDAHANTERRGKGFPYIIHPMEAMEIVATMTTDQEILAAAALHDTVEDTEVTIEEIRKQFGGRIASLVADESEEREPNMDETASWRQRKEAAISHLEHASYEAKIVAMGDKLSNMRAIARDYQVIGDQLWERFHAPNGKADHEWHYRRLANALIDLIDTNAYQEFIELINKVFGKPTEWQPTLIDLQDYEESGDGFTAISYNHKDGKSMIKLYNDFIPKHVPQGELQNAYNLVKMGIHTPLPKRYITDGKRFGAEFQRISPKRSFARALSQEPERVEYYAQRFAERCRQLHSIPCDTINFPSIVTKYHDIISNAKRFTDEEKKRLLEFLDSVPTATTCLHGDLHIGNIITNDTEDWWIDMADFSYGYPLFDLGMTYIAANCDPEELTQKLYHFSNELFAKFWYHFVRAYFGTDDPKAIADYETQVKKFAALRLVHLDEIEPLPQEMKVLIYDYLLK